MLSCINISYNSIQFPYGIEKKGNNLDILIIRSGHKIETRVIENQQTQTYLFIDIHLHHLRGSVAH